MSIVDIHKLQAYCLQNDIRRTLIYLFIGAVLTLIMTSIYYM